LSFITGFVYQTKRYISEMRLFQRLETTNQTVFYHCQDVNS